MRRAAITSSAPTPPLTVTDLKQWAYCARIPYYRHVMPVDFVRTFSMERGRLIQAAVETLETRRSFKRYGLERGERRFGTWLYSPSLNLSGKIDLLILHERGCHLVDFKHTDGGVRYNHRIQLAAYALLVQETLARKVTRAFVYLVPSRQLSGVSIGTREKDAVRWAAAEIRNCIRREELPARTAARSRCIGCEFRNYCGDIW